VKFGRFKVLIWQFGTFCLSFRSIWIKLDIKYGFPLQTDYCDFTTSLPLQDGQSCFITFPSSTKVLAKQKLRHKSTTTIAIKKRTAAIDSRRRIDPEASVPAPARPQEEGAHRNPHNGVGSRKGLAENATDATRRPTSERRRLRGSPHRSDDRIQSEREE
jgi:hypothetical protein